MRAQIIWIALAMSSIAACASPDSHDDSSASATTGAAEKRSSAKDENACHLLTGEYVAQMAEHALAIADQTDAEPGYSVCQWEDAKGFVAFKLAVYWRGGRQQWDIWRLAQGFGDSVFVAKEGVSLDSVVQQGPVAAIGDGAYFSELLPSLVLKDDVLFEITLALIPRAGAKFKPLAGKLLSRV